MQSMHEVMHQLAVVRVLSDAAVKASAIQVFWLAGLGRRPSWRLCRKPAHPPRVQALNWRLTHGRQAYSATEKIAPSSPGLLFTTTADAISRKFSDLKYLGAYALKKGVHTYKHSSARLPSRHTCLPVCRLTFTPEPAESGRPAWLRRHPPMNRATCAPFIGFAMN